jgi:peptidoglycan-N-acetylglucosamine deacetylase
MNIAITLLGCLFAVIIIIMYFQPRFIIRWIAAQNSEVLFFVQTKAKVLALTIDDAPHNVVTPQILDVLKAHSAKATFFSLGENAKANINLIERIRNEGHELGNHLMKDRPSILLSASQFESELLEVENLLHLKGPVKWVRPGSGWFNKRMLHQIKKCGYRCALGSVYPHDTLVRNVWIISKYITTQVYPGAIIILHDGASDRLRTVKVLKKILPELKKRGYEIVTLSRLISS